MRFTSTFVVAADAVFTPASEFDEEMRNRLNCDSSAYVVGLEGARTAGKVIDARMRDVLSRLTQPGRIVDAVIAVSRERAEDPEELLNAAIPGILRLIASGVLQSTDGAARRFRGKTQSPGTSFATYTIVSCIQALEDSEVYQARSVSGRRVLLKVARPESESGKANIVREASILLKLSGAPTPTLYEHGESGDRVFMAAEWVHGSDAEVVAAEHRRLPAAVRRRRGAALCVSIASAFEGLHAHRILHGDVHERNILVDREGRVTLIDFGLARHLDDSEPPPPRAGAAFYFEPEFARAREAGEDLPPTSALGEQFLVAAMLFALVTGSTYADFSYDAELAFRQIASPSPRTFSSCGVQPWPDLESVLQRALSSDPVARYPSMADFTEALRDVARRAERREEDAVDALGATTAASLRLDRLLDTLATSEALLERGVQRAPTASYAYGAAGISRALLHLSYAQDGARLLAAADVWLQRALSAARSSAKAFYADDDELSERELGSASLLFSRPGVYATAAFVAQARGDLVAMERALTSYLRSLRVQTSTLDFASGAPGNLLGCARLLALTPSQVAARSRVRAAGDRLLGGVWRALNELPAIASARHFANLGIAHGWAGALYASLAWSEATGTAPPETLRERVDELAALAESHGRGARYAWLDSSNVESDPRLVAQYMSGWCNGSSGFVFFWLQAAAAFPGSRYVELAEALAWNAWEDESEDEPSLCCGLAGRVYALLAMYRSSGDDSWLLRARALTARGAEAIQDEDLDVGLLKGHLGLALAQRELQWPELARMPLFEAEGWGV